MHEVGPCELESAAERTPPLERDHGDDQAGEPEPDHGRQEPEEPEETEQDDRRCERDRSERRSFGELLPRNPFARDESGRERVRKTGGDRPHRQSKPQPRDARRLGDRQTGRGRSDSQGKRVPETASVEADRLCDELADGARLGRQRRRYGLRGAAPLLACHRPRTYPFFCTRETRVTTTPAHRQAKSKTAACERRLCHKSGTSASVRG